MSKSVVIVCTSENKLGDHDTGAWSEEITGPYWVFKDKGYNVSFASVQGGKVPIDEASLSATFLTENDKRFEAEGVLEQLKDTPQISDIKVDDVDCVFFAGGHGTVVDFPKKCGDLATAAYGKGKIVAAVCHGPTALYAAKDGEEPLVKGKQVAGFSDEEEVAVGLKDKVDYTPEGKLKELGGIYSKGDPWSEYAVRDGNLVTGQNPQSSVKCAQLVVEALG
uniref:DJ-1/PfpI domain-containing protein n=1 Tax=Zooxanthella nutricula TaxID=1333877 RepID=A0A6U6UL03_9DINO